MGTENKKTGTEETEIVTMGGKVWLEDGIIRSKVLVEGEYTMEHAKDDARAFRELGRRIEGKKLLLVEPGRISKVSLKTRRYQSTEGPKVVDKIAQVIENPVTRVIGSFFLGLKRMPIPVKMFGTVEEAAKWLKEA
jgi:hypothetical protein